MAHVLYIWFMLLLVTNAAGAAGFILVLNNGPTKPVATSCGDSDASCKYYPGNMCKDYSDWASVNCRAFCGYCPVGPTAAPACVDNVIDCASYTKSVCTNPAYDKWVDENCRLYCSRGSCRNPTIPPTPAPGCTDLVSDCHAYGDVCNNPLYTAWVRKNCRQYCSIGTCRRATPGPTAPPACVDAISDCSSYGTSVCTDPTYIPWAQDNCRQWCQFDGCRRATAAPTPPTPAPKCVDRINNCFIYGKGVCNDPQYSGWVGDNCRKYCSKC